MENLFNKNNSPAGMPDHTFPVITSDLPADNPVNWAGNVQFSTEKIFFPESVAEVQDLVKSYQKIKALGSRHCFNRIADSRDCLLSSKQLNQVVSLDTKAHTVTVEAGIKYGELAPFLHAHGYALPNLASLPHISVAGSIITATHGSGINIGNLATSVVGLEMVLADGRLESFSRDKDGETFAGMVVGLGALGIITKVTLALQPGFAMKQKVYLNLPLSQFGENFTSIVSAGYSVSLFTTWQGDNINQVWIKSVWNDNSDSVFEKEFYGAQASDQQVHPIAGMPPENCTDQLGIPGPWFERLPHFKMGFTPSSGVELQSEYFIPRHHAVAAIQAIARLGEQISLYPLISEIRTIAADDFWLSPCYQQPSVALHFTWKQDWAAVSKLLPIIEKELAPFDARPHWGKLFTMEPEVLANRYERMPDFKNLVNLYDPEGKFRNEFLNSLLFDNG